MKVYYVNSREDKVYLYGHPYLFQEGDLFDYTWSYLSYEGESGNKILSFNKAIEKRTFKIAVMPDYSLDKEARKKKFVLDVEHLLSTFEYDILNNKMGKLYCETGEYLPCQIIASKKEDWSMNVPFMFNTFTLLCANPMWIKEKNHSFMKSISTYSRKNLDYPMDYPFDYYCGNVGHGVIGIGHYSSCDFLLTIHGPCVNPRVLINEKAYQVFIELNDNERVEIDTKHHTVYKYNIQNKKENVFDLRLKESSVFEKIVGENATINWDGSFGFDITLYKERSQPEWSL